MIRQGQPQYGAANRGPMVADYSSNVVNRVGQQNYVDYKQTPNVYRPNQSEPQNSFQNITSPQRYVGGQERLGTLNTYNKTYDNLNNTTVQSNVIPHVHQYMVSQPQQVIQPITQDIIQTVQEVHHRERPLQVVTVADMEQKYKTKCFQLEQTVYDLQVSLQKYKNTQVTEVVQYVQDDSKIRELEQRIRDLVESDNNSKRQIQNQEEELDDQTNRYKRLEGLYAQAQGSEEVVRQLVLQKESLESDINTAGRTIQERDQDIIKLKSGIGQRDDEINNLRDSLDQMDERLTELSQSEATIANQKAEIETWKTRYRDSNQQYFKAQEDLMLKEAELDSLKNRKVVVVGENTTNTKTTIGQQINKSVYQGGGGSAFSPDPRASGTGVRQSYVGPTTDQQGRTSGQESTQRPGVYEPGQRTAGQEYTSVAKPVERKSEYGTTPQNRTRLTPDYKPSDYKAK